MKNEEFHCSIQTGASKANNCLEITQATSITTPKGVVRDAVAETYINNKHEWGFLELLISLVQEDDGIDKVYAIPVGQALEYCNIQLDTKNAARPLEKLQSVAGDMMSRVVRTQYDNCTALFHFFNEMGASPTGIQIKIKDQDSQRLLLNMKANVELLKRCREYFASH